MYMPITNDSENVGFRRWGMFKKREVETFVQDPVKEEKKEKEVLENSSLAGVRTNTKNAIVKGSKLTGDILITYDLELDGEVEGNITSEQKSNVVIKGTCNGNIRTKEGSVNIEGKMSKGDIFAGGDIRITGSFTGGKADAKGTIYVNGEFSGRLEGKDIEIGPATKGKGELFYKDNISIAKGARIEVNISRLKADGVNKSSAPENKVVNIERPAREEP